LHAQESECTLPGQPASRAAITDSKGPQVEPAILDRNPTRWNTDGQKSHFAGQKKNGVVRSLLFGAMATAALLWVAAYNGYPTVYPDTGGYLYTAAFLIAIPPFRAPGYSIFVRLTGLGASAWFTVIMQAIVVVIVLYETCKYVIGGDSKFRDHCLLAILFLLAALSSLPWEASELMPDVFASVVFLSAFLLAFNTQLGLPERIGLAALLAISVSSHMSLLPIATLFVVALAIAKIAGWQVQGAPPARSMLAWLLAPLVVAGLWTATLNRETGLGFRLSASANEFLLARLFDDGLAADYLRANCSKEPFVACRHLAHLPTSDAEFLFWSPLRDEMAGHGNEMAEVVRGTIAAHPLMFVMSSVKQTLLQFVSFRTGDEIHASNLNAPNTNGLVIQQVFPRDKAAFSNARQARGRMNAVTKAAVVIDAAVFCLSGLACVFFARTARAKQVTQLFYWAIVFLVINAAICGSLAGVNDRYQSRVAWIVPLCLLSYVCSLVAEDREFAKIPARS
jgi:hypothetical protein